MKIDNWGDVTHEMQRTKAFDLLNDLFDQTDEDCTSLESYRMNALRAFYCTPETRFWCR